MICSTLDHVSRVSLTMDGWTSPYQDEFLGVTCHWLDTPWTQQELIIGFEPTETSHSAECLLESLISIVERFNLQKKIHAITTDNASNMSKTMMLLEEYTRGRSDWAPFDAKKQHVRCLGHILNLAVQEILSSICAPAPDHEHEIEDQSPRTAVQNPTTITAPAASTSTPAAISSVPYSQATTVDGTQNNTLLEFEENEDIDETIIRHELLGDPAAPGPEIFNLSSENPLINLRKLIRAIRYDTVQSGENR